MLGKVEQGGEKGGMGTKEEVRTKAAESLAALQREVLANKAVVLALQPVKQVRV